MTTTVPGSRPVYNDTHTHAHIHTQTDRQTDTVVVVVVVVVEVVDLYSALRNANS